MITARGTALTEIIGSHTVVHPGAVVIHSANASIADAAVVGHGWFERLTLSAHTVRILHEALTLRRNGSQGNTSRICQARLGM